MAGEISNILSRLGIENLNSFLVSLLIAIGLVVIGIIVGKLIGKLLRRSFEGSDIKKTLRPSFIDLFVNLSRWAVYILFADFALLQLNIPKFTQWITAILVVFPALFGALILIFVGFILAIYFKEVIAESKIRGWEVLSKTLFYFIFYIFMFFAIKTALISQTRELVNIVLIVFTISLSLAVGYYHAIVKKGL